MSITQQINEAKSAGDVMNVINASATYEEFVEGAEAYAKIEPAWFADNLIFGISYFSSSPQKAQTLTQWCNEWLEKRKTSKIKTNTI